MDLAALRTKLESYGQEHLLQHYDRLKQEEKSAFLDELSHLDFDRVKRIYELSCEEANNSGEKQKTLEPIPESSSDSVASASDELKNE